MQLLLGLATSVWCIMALIRPQVKLINSVTIIFSIIAELGAIIANDDANVECQSHNASEHLRQQHTRQHPP